MKRAYSASAYAGLYERYCKQHFPAEAGEIFRKAEAWYRELLKGLPDLGETWMARNMLDWFTILAFYEASGHRLDGEVLLALKREEASRRKGLALLVNGNRKWPYRVFEAFYRKYDRLVRAHQEKGEWRDAWRVEINPEHRTEGFCFHLVGCPIAKHARAHGYEALLPYLCKTDHFLAETLHTRLIRTQTEALGGDACDYWYVGDRSPVLAQYRDLPRI